MTTNLIEQALQTLAEFAKTAPGRLPGKVQEAVQLAAALEQRGEGELPPLPNPKYIWHDADEPGEAELFEFKFSGAVDGRCEICERLYTADQMQAYARAALAQQARPQPLTDEQAKQLLRHSDLLDMFLEIGWYSAPRKHFDVNALSLIREVELAHGIGGHHE